MSLSDSSFPAWKVKRLLHIGSERTIRQGVQVMRDFGSTTIERTRKLRATDKASTREEARPDTHDQIYRLLRRNNKASAIKSSLMW